MFFFYSLIRPCAMVVPDFELIGKIDFKEVYLWLTMSFNSGIKSCLSWIHWCAFIKSKICHTLFTLPWSTLETSLFYLWCVFVNSMVFLKEHYDWGLRAIKSVLVVAGTLRRSDPNMSEDKVLMRALRDFNVPKITVEDMSVFLNLIGDLFPALDVERKR